MRLIDLTCPHCGAQLKIEEGMARAFCMHCGHQLIIDDQRVRADSGSFRDAGYQFEQGRMQAQAERAVRQRAASMTAEAARARERHLNSMHRWLLVLAAAVIFIGGLYPMNRYLAIALSAAAIVTAIADRRINLFIRILVIPGMMLVLLVRSVFGY